MNKKEIEDILKCNNYMECMKILYNINPKSYKENELPKKLQNNLVHSNNPLFISPSAGFNLDFTNSCNSSLPIVSLSIISSPINSFY